MESLIICTVMYLDLVAMANLSGCSILGTPDFHTSRLDSYIILLYQGGGRCWWK
jgi:hypothetical protein